MSSTQPVASPRAPRAHQPSPKPAGQAVPNTNSGRGSRRAKGNRAHNANNANHAIAQQDPSLSESAVFSSEEMAIPTGPRQVKKHTNSQPATDRTFSPTAAPTASLTDSELGPFYSAASPAKPQGAYAGPTFHASPAPSALPIPKFLSKSVPPKTQTGPPTPPPEYGSDSASPPSPSPSPSRGAPIPPPSRHQDSPLDMLFKADRAEKARGVNCSPSSAMMSSPNVPLSGGRPQHMKHDSFGSLNVPFPIELEANSKPTRASPPVAPLGAHRSVTAPSKIPQADTLTQTKESDALRDLMDMLSMSQKKAGTSTPPKTVDHRPSSAAMHNSSPSSFHDGRSSAFRSSSGPTTPAPPMNPRESQGLLYGNQNLNNLFKAVGTDSAKRNSGLRTEITADSPVIPQGGFPSIHRPNNDNRGSIGNVLSDPAAQRRGSAPQIAPIPPYRGTGAPGNQQVRSPNRRSYNARPDSYPRHSQGDRFANAQPTNTPATLQKSTTAMAFIPSSVRAKPPPTPPKKTESDNLTLEQNLKRMLNLAPGNTNSIQ